MHKVNISGLTQTELNQIVSNAERVLSDDLTLNQRRQKVAHLFGAKSWQSLQASVSTPVSASHNTQLAPTPATPDQIQLLWASPDNGIAFALLDGCLTGFHPRSANTTRPDYDWSNGFEVQTITPDEALTLRSLGYHELVEAYDRQCAIHDDCDDDQ